MLLCDFVVEGMVSWKFTTRKWFMKTLFCLSRYSNLNVIMIFLLIGTIIESWNYCW